MVNQTHWEAVYREKAADDVSWYRPHLETSIQLIQTSASNSSAAIIDVGGGESTLVDDLLTLGYRDISVLDISREAIQKKQQRLGTASDDVKWLVADITRAELPQQHYDVWHDRAVFHFLLEPELQAAYVQQVLHSVKAGGHLVIAVFGPEGPTQCSGLPTARYDIATLCERLGPNFHLLRHSLEEHHTPGGKAQQFLYAHFQLDR
ncbi:class I SAM-dependent methyltransferase [Halomonas vilamensis]|uniref:Class I SAM-dependent methyltransferase n=1 Tax=Vreelandella vilamensis TaxID=531309 RepID=A0ABU1H4S8_9GAMM|nr:class I SAM-dependent methyltransferase [Halomonas vilamensis]MDR5898513.1 class I SAM-dependent methyltransferase [Halomonas vilamensis]